MIEIAIVDRSKSLSKNSAVQFESTITELCGRSTFCWGWDLTCRAAKGRSGLRGKQWSKDKKKLWKAGPETQQSTLSGFGRKCDGISFSHLQQAGVAAAFLEVFVVCHAESQWSPVPYILVNPDFPRLAGRSGTNVALQVAIRKGKIIFLFRVWIGGFGGAFFCQYSVTGLETDRGFDSFLCSISVFTIASVFKDSFKQPLGRSSECVTLDRHWPKSAGEKVGNHSGRRVSHLTCRPSSSHLCPSIGHLFPTQENYSNLRDF